jgi:hypothetical protein
MTTYSWQIDSMDVYPTYQTVTDAVESMHWRLTADDGLGHQAQAYGETKAGPVDVNSFIPYPNLTLPVVQGWVETQLGAAGVDELKMSLSWQIEQQVNPDTLSLAPPWQ